MVCDGGSGLEKAVSQQDLDNQTINDDACPLLWIEILSSCKLGEGFPGGLGLDVEKIAIIVGYLEFILNLDK